MNLVIDQFDDLYKYNVNDIIDAKNPLVSKSLEEFVESIDRTLNERTSSFLLMTTTTKAKKKKNDEFNKYYCSDKSLFIDYSIDYEEEEEKNDDDFIQSFNLRNDNYHHNRSSSLFIPTQREGEENENDDDCLEEEECWNDATATTTTTTTTKNNEKLVSSNESNKAHVPLIESANKFDSKKKEQDEKQDGIRTGNASLKDWYKIVTLKLYEKLCIPNDNDFLI